MSLQIIAIVSPKGGVGKTTTTANLGASLAILGKRVLMIDMDPNSALTLSFGIDIHHLRSGIYELYTGSSQLHDLIHRTNLLNLDIIPSNVNSTERETRLTALAKNRTALKRRLLNWIQREKHSYDYILIDSQPLLGDLTMSILYSAHIVLVPLQCGYFALSVVERLMHTIQRVRQASNRELRMTGIIMNFFEKNTLASQRTVSEARIRYGADVFDTVIPKNTTLSLAAFEHKPVALLDITAPGAVAYLDLAREFLDKCESTKP